MKKKWTPAPWKFEGHSVLGGTPPKKMRLHIEYKNKICDVPVADMVTGLLSSDEYRANGRLIEQAPVMFDLLEDVESAMDKEQKERFEEIKKGL